MKRFAILSFLAVTLIASLWGCGGDNNSSGTLPGFVTLSGTVVEGIVSGAQVTAYSVIVPSGAGPVPPISSGVVAIIGANGPQLGATRTDANGRFSLTIPSQSGPVSLQTSGGSFISEANGATIGTPGALSVLFASVTANLSGISINPLSTFADAIGTTNLGARVNMQFPPNYTVDAVIGGADAVEAYYGIGTNPAALIPSYSPNAIGTDAGKMGLILGALINEDQELCPGAAGGLVTALANDIADGQFNGYYGAHAIPYCGATLPAVAGISEFQDALSALQQNAFVTGSLVFGGAGNALTVNGIGAESLLPSLAEIEPALDGAAPIPLNTFAPPGSTATMNFSRLGATATLLPNGKVLIAGGELPTNGLLSFVLDETDLYDPASNSFAPTALTATMNSQRVSATATLLPNGKVLIAGGYSNSNVWATTELYDPATNTFASPATTPTMNTVRAGAVAISLPNGKVLIAGGQVGIGTGSPALASTELYDPVTNSFAPPGSTPAMNVARSGATAILLPNGKVLIAGGVEGTSVLASTELYDPAAQSFVPTGSTPTMNVARALATATLLPNGKVLIAGGQGGPGAGQSTDLYDSLTNTFASAGSTATMNSRRISATATLLPNGEVLIAGSFPFVNTTELYNPTTNTFASPASTAAMNDGRSFATATLLPNGEVLIAGGNFNLSAGTTDLYTP